MAMNFDFGNPASSQQAALHELEELAQQAREGALSDDELLASLPRARGAYLATLMIALGRRAQEKPELRAQALRALRREAIRPTNKVRIAMSPLMYTHVALLLIHELAEQDAEWEGFVARCVELSPVREQEFLLAGLAGFRFLPRQDGSTPPPPPEEIPQQLHDQEEAPEPEPERRKVDPSRFWHDDMP